MADYAIQVARTAEKEIAKLPQQLLPRISNKIDQLGTNPRPSGCAKLKAARNRWRVRVGDYRIVYSIDDQKQLVDVIAVRHRRFVYE